MKWKVEVKETISQSSVYIIEADTKEQAEEIARTEEGEMEQLSYYPEARTVESILSVEPAVMEKHPERFAT
jgi:hypothetical protein